MAVPTLPPLMEEHLLYDPTAGNFTFPKGTRRIIFVDGGTITMIDTNGNNTEYEGLPPWFVLDDFKPARSLALGATATKVIVQYTLEVT